MFNKKSARELPPALQQLGQHYTDRLAQVIADHPVGSYHRPLLTTLYSNLADHVDSRARYKRGTFPSLQSRMENGDASTIEFARSPMLTNVFREVLPNLSNVADAINDGDGGCFSIDRKRSGRKDIFPSYHDLVSRSNGPSGNRSVEDWYDLFTRQQDYINQTNPVTKIHSFDRSLFGTCNDGMCKSCPVCKACGEELKRSIDGALTQQNMSSIESLDAPEAASVHIQSLITTASVLGKHLLHLGSTEDTKDDPLHMWHGTEHGNASSLLQASAILLHHAAIQSYQDSQGRGGVPIKNMLWMPERARLTTASDPIDPVPYGSYNLGKEQRKRKNK